MYGNRLIPVAAALSLMAVLTSCSNPNAQVGSTPSAKPRGYAATPSEEAATPSAEATPIEEPVSEVHGLLLTNGSTALGSTVSLTVMDPTTGEGLQSYSYPTTGDTKPAVDTPWAFSPDLKYMAVLSGADDGTREAGWIDQAGNFYRIGGVLSQTGSFSGNLSSDLAAFVGDRFYFNTRSLSNTKTDKIYSIALDSVVENNKLTKGDFRLEPVSSPVQPNARPKVAPDGTVTKITNGCQAAYGKWAFQPRAFVTGDKAVSLFQDTIVSMPLKATCYKSFIKADYILPESDQRVVAVVASPDQKEIAFRTLRGLESSIYTVSANGGDPKLVGSVSDQGLYGWR